LYIFISHGIIYETKSGIVLAFIYLKNIMKLFDKIKNFLSGGQSSNYLWEGKGMGDAKTRDLYNAYNESYVVYACLDKIQKNTAKIDISLYQSQRNKKVKEIYEHEVLNLLYKVNKFTTFRKQIGLTQQCLDLIGSAYWLKIRNKKKEVIELWLLRPDLLTTRSENGEYISYYEYTGTGKTLRFEVNDIIPFLNTNPKDQKKGQSKLQPAMDLVRSQILSSRWNMNFFYREARPDAILNVKGRKQLDKEGKSEVREEWNENFQGAENTHKIAIMQGEVDFKVIAQNQKDMDFVNLDASVRNNIMIALGVPKPILLPEEGNKTTVEGAIYIFMSQTIEPNMQNIIDTLNEFLMPDFDISLYLDFVSPVPSDKEAEANINCKYVDSGIMTRNDAREKLGLPELEGGDEILVPVTLVPISSSGEAQEEKLEKMIKVLKVSKETKEKLIEEEEEKRFYKSIRGRSKYFKRQEDIDNSIKNMSEAIVKAFDKKEVKTKTVKIKKYTPEMKQKIWEHFDKSFTGTESLFEKMFKKLEKEQEARVIKYLFKKRKSKEYILKKDLVTSVDNYKWKEEINIFIDVALPLHTETIIDAGKEAAKRIGSAFDVNAEVRAYIAKKNLKFATAVNNTTKENLKKTLSKGIEEGESLEDLKKRVEHTFEVRQGAGARAVASTETLASVNGGWIEAYKQSEVVEKKEWFHAGHSDNDRPEHITMSGEVVGIKEKFSNNMDFPGDPDASPNETVNCKCVVLEVVE